MSDRYIVQSWTEFRALEHGVYNPPRRGVWVVDRSLASKPVHYEHRVDGEAAAARWNRNAAHASTKESR